MVHSTPKRGRSVAVCAWLALALLVAHLADAATTLRFVQIVHRHGSRSAVVSYNETAICGDKPCGYLNDAGKQMLVNTGAFLRKRYNSDASVVSAPLFPSESYDIDVSYTRCTDVLRTLQSADGLLRGMFPKMETFFPAIHTVEKPSDWLLVGEVVPFAYAYYNLNQEGTNEFCNPWVDAVIDTPTLQAVAKEAHSEGYCADLSRRCQCVTMLYDIGAALAAEGRIDKYPLLKANLNKLRQVDELYWTYEFGYNESNAVNRKMGSQGQTFVRQILDNVEQHMKGKSTFKLYHYSGHDTTLSPLAGTLRDTSAMATRPPFAQLYAFELLYDDEANAYYMRVLRGHPGQTPDTNYEFSWEEDFQLKCMDSNGGIYNAPKNTCPYYDFVRLVDSSKPTHPAGLCYLDDAYMSLFNCPNTESEPLTEACKKYRKLCPAWSCPSGYTVDSVTLRCKCSDASCMPLSGVSAADATLEKKQVSAGATAGIAIATFVFGAIVAGLVFLCFLRKRGSVKHPSDVSE